MLVFVVIGFGGGRQGDGGLAALGALPVALLVIGIGASLGGPTGYAINPARDLGPRIAHAILPIAGKGGSDWSLLVGARRRPDHRRRARRSRRDPAPAAPRLSRGIRSPLIPPIH